LETNNEFFTLENNDNVLFLTMNAPGNNIMTSDFLDGFEKAIEKLEKEYKEDKNIKGLVIKGGGRHFSVGADVPSLVQRSSEAGGYISSKEELPESHIKQKHAFTVLREMPFPVISVVTGYCIGSGSEIAANSHIRICEANARAGQPESTFGILPALGGIRETIDICGFSRAVDLVFTGELFTADKAGEYNWADIVCEKKKGLETAVSLIDHINSRGTGYDVSSVPEYISEFNKRG